MSIIILYYYIIILLILSVRSDQNINGGVPKQTTSKSQDFKIRMTTHVRNSNYEYFYQFHLSSQPFEHFWS